MLAYGTQSYAMPQISAVNRPAFGVVVNSSGVPSWNASHYPHRFYRSISNLPDPKGSLIFTEYDQRSHTGQDQGNGRRIGLPSALINTAAAQPNYTPDLHGDSNKNNNLFADGHAATHNFYSLLGTGTMTAPKGAWTITAGD